MIWNCDCIEGSKRHLKDESVDLMICDPPFGIGESGFAKHYYRDEKYVLEGYVEAPPDYRDFSLRWLAQAKRVMKPNASMYVVSGWTNLKDLLIAIDETELTTINHLIWKYNFGCRTASKYVSSHYHILYLKKDRAKPTFNTYCRFGFAEKDENGKSLYYQDTEDVWVINKEYQPSKVKNKNKLPDELVRKMVLYSSNVEDVVCDFFLGNFTTANVAKALGREVTGFEENPASFDHFYNRLEQIEFGSALADLKVVADDRPANQGKPLLDAELAMIRDDFAKAVGSKKQIIEDLCRKYGRGRWSIERIIK